MTPKIEITNEDKKKYILSPEQKQRKTELARIRYNLPNSKSKETAIKYRDNNRIKRREYCNNYRTKNPSGIYDVIKQGAKKRGLFVSISRIDFCNWYLKQERVCYYCKRSEINILSSDKVMQIKCKRLTIDRKENSTGYESGNLVLCCKRCNSIKGDFFTETEMLKIGEIIKNK